VTGPKAPEGDLFIPGTYTESAKGFGGDVTVTLEVSEDAIEDVQIEGDDETENIGSFAVEMLDDRIMEAQSPKVDALSGATVTSNAILGAAKKAMRAAGADMNSFPDKKEEPVAEKKNEELKTDIVIIGASGAGMTAAINAKQAGKDVILATGGFGNNENMIVQYREDLKGTVTTSAPGITGDGIVMAEEVGADLVDIDQIQFHPTVEQKTSMLITESVRGDGAILVNQDGKRFTDELLTRDVVSAAELEQPGSYAYIIFDQRLREGLKATEKYISTGITVEGETIEDLAEKIDVDPKTLAETLSNWNKYVADKNDPDFGRTTGMEMDLSQAPYYAIKIAPGIHHTMGGVHIDTSAKVIDTDGNAIPGLFAAGEVVGGVHGGNRIGGNAVADIVVFGKIASDSAVEWCDQN